MGIFLHNSRSISTCCVEKYELCVKNDGYVTTLYNEESLANSEKKKIIKIFKRTIFYLRYKIRSSE